MRCHTGYNRHGQIARPLYGINDRLGGGLPVTEGGSVYMGSKCTSETYSVVREDAEFMLDESTGVASLVASVISGVFR